MSRPAGPRLPARVLPAVLALLFGADGATEARSDPAPPPGTRTLILVRHGLYDSEDLGDDDTGRPLTAQGREQARFTGHRLAAWPARIDALYSSAMRRARETAEIVADSLPGRVPRIVRDLRECTPPSDRADATKDLAPGEADECRTRLEAAFARYFRPSGGADSTEVLICHGNVIRYLVCRVLGLDSGRWLALTIANCSLTVVQVRPGGEMRLLAFSDVGHLPVELQTYPKPQPPATGAAGR